MCEYTESESVSDYHSSKCGKVDTSNEFWEDTVGHS